MFETPSVRAAREKAEAASREANIRRYEGNYILGALLPWIEGPKLLSLADMNKYLASRLVAVSESLVQCGFTSVLTTGDELSEDDKGHVDKMLTHAEKELKFLGLNMTCIAVDRARSQLKGTTASKLAVTVDSLKERFHDEIASITLFYVTPDKLKFYNRADLFGEEFKAAFPTANGEISEAGNCFAFDRFTACGFHLMRSLEVVLKVLFSTLGLPPLTTAGARNWNGILRDIRAKLDSDKTIPDWDFYDSAYAFLAAAKNPMRNATMHVDAVYDEPSVSRVFDVVGGFMRHIATKLKE